MKTACRRNDCSFLFNTNVRRNTQTSRGAYCNASRGVTVVLFRWRVKKQVRYHAVWCSSDCKATVPDIRLCFELRIVSSSAIHLLRVIPIFSYSHASAWVDETLSLVCKMTEWYVLFDSFCVFVFAPRTPAGSSTKSSSQGTCQQAACVGSVAHP